MYKITTFTLITFLSTLLMSNEYENNRKIKLKEQVYGQIKHIKKVSNSVESNSDKYKKGSMLSTEIKTFSDISKDIDTEISQTKKQIKLLIKIIAQDIEIHNGVSGSLQIKTSENEVNIEYIPKKSLSKTMNKKREKLLKANLANTVSIKSATLAFEILANINTQLKTSAINAKTRKEKEIFYLKQAIFVYEMSDIVINLLDKLTLSGKEDIETIYNNTKKQSQIVVADIKKQKVKTKELVKNGDIPQGNLEQSLKRLDQMINAQSLMMNSWESMMNKLGKEGQYLKKLKSKNRLLKYYKENARLQIVTLRGLKTVADLKDSIGSLDKLIGIVGSLDLAPLDDRAVSQLLGIDFK